jgi:glycosyltransferase 2 family protein
VLWTVVDHGRTGPIERAVAQVLAAFPTWADEVLGLLYAFGFLYAVGVIGALAVGGRRHLLALRDVLVALVIASLLGVVLIRWFQDAWPFVLPEIGLESPARQTPVFRIAIVAAVLLAASPALARPLRRLGWAVVVSAAIAGAALGFGLPSDAVGAIGVGTIAASATFLALGAPGGHPDLATVRSAMARLGSPVTDLGYVTSASWGVRPIVATSSAGTPVVIKAYGRDATDSQVLAKAWRSLWYREQRQTFTFSRLQSVEHEALVTLWAGRHGIPVPEVVAAGEASAEVALLALTTGGTRLGRLPADALADERLVAIWRDVARLHAAGMAHGTLSARVIRVDGDEHRFDEFGGGTIAAGLGERPRDVVALLYSLGALVGPERAVATAREGIGDEALVAALPYLQLPALTSSIRAEAEDPKTVVRDIGTALTAATGTDLPEPLPLRRVSPRTLVLAVLGILAAIAVVPAIAGIDLERVAAQLGGRRVADARGGAARRPAGLRDRRLGRARGRRPTRAVPAPARAPDRREVPRDRRSRRHRPDRRQRGLPLPLRHHAGRLAHAELDGHGGGHHRRDDRPARCPAVHRPRSRGRPRPSGVRQHPAARRRAGRGRWSRSWWSSGSTPCASGSFRCWPPCAVRYGR